MARGHPQVTLLPAMAGCRRRWRAMLPQCRLNALRGPAKIRVNDFQGLPDVSSKPIAAKTLSAGQRAYEAKRAAKAGMSLEKWLDAKQRQMEAEEIARRKLAAPAKPAKKPGLFARLMERAQRPLGRAATTGRTSPR
jgi:hypothetical protein